MITYRIKVRVSPSKQQEFHQAMSNIFHPVNEDTFSGYIMLDTLDHNLFMIMIDLKNRKELDAFIKSDDYSYIEGALKVLGKIEEAGVFSSEKSSTLE